MKDAHPMMYIVCILSHSCHHGVRLISPYKATDMLVVDKIARHTH